MIEETKTYSRQDIVNILKDIDVIIDAFDRIGSGFSDDIESSIATKIFLREKKVFQMLTKMRHKLSEPFSQELGDDHMDELEREMCDLEYWTIPYGKSILELREILTKVTPKG